MSAQRVEIQQVFASQAKHPGLHTLLPVPLEQGEVFFLFLFTFLSHPPHTLNSRELLITIPKGVTGNLLDVLV